MRTTGRLVLIWLLLAIGAGGVMAENLSGFYLKGTGEKTKETKFTNQSTMGAVIDPMRLTGGTPPLKGTINEVSNLTVESGKITKDDWYSILKDARKDNEGLYRLRVFHAFHQSVEVDDMQDYYDNQSFARSVENFKVPKLKRLSCYAFYDSRIQDFDLSGVTEIGYGAFQYACLLKSGSFPKLEKLGAKAFYSAQQLRVLVTPKLKTLNNAGGGEIYLDDRRDGTKKKQTWEAGQTFADCSEFSEWRLGVSFDPNNIDENHFKNCPEGRNILLVAEDGKTPLTGSVLTSAISKFKASSGWKNGKWHGWNVGETLQPITIDVDNNRHQGVFTLPVNAAKPGEKVRIFAENGGNNGALKILKITLQYNDGTTKEIDYINDPSFVMPNQPVKITVNAETSHVKARFYSTVNGVEYVDVLEEKSFWHLMTELKKLHQGLDWSEVWRIEVLEGDMTDYGWHYLSAFRNLREFEIMQTVSYVAQPMERMHGVDYAYYFTHRFESAMLRKVIRLPKYFLKGLRSVRSIMLPNLKEFGPHAVFYKIPHTYDDVEISPAVVMGLPGSKLPDGVTKETFLDMYPPRWKKGKLIEYPKNLYLIFLDADGKELTGQAKENAYRMYKNDSRDGAINDELWFGWKLSYLRVRIDPTAQINGTVHLITPPHGVAEEGVPVQFEVLPKSGYGVEKVEYVVDGSNDRKVLDPDSDGKYNLKMPSASITIHVKYGERKFNVVVEEGIQKGTLAANPNMGVSVGTKVEVTNTPTEGYEVNEEEFFYQRWQNGVAVGDKVKIVKGADGKYTFEMPNFNVKVFAKFKAKLWKLTHCADIEGGMLTTVPTAGDVETDARVIAIVTPSQDYVNLSLTWKKEGTNVETPVQNNMFTMPAANVEVCAKFAKINTGTPGKYAIVTSAEPRAGGTIGASPKVDLTKDSKSEITVEAACGYKFVDGSLQYCKYGAEFEAQESNWLAVPINANKYELTMPDYTVKVRAKFEALQQTIKLPYGNTGIDPVSKCQVSVKSPATATEYKTGAEITLQVETKTGWQVESLRWREDNGTSSWKSLNLSDPRFTMPCHAVEVDATFVRIGFEVVDIATTGGTLVSNPRRGVAPGSVIVVEISPEDGYAIVADPQNYAKRAVWWSVEDATDPSVRETLVEGETKFRVEYSHNLFTFIIPEADKVKHGRVWVWADFTNDGNRVGFVPFEDLEGKKRGTLDANSTSSVPVGFQVRVVYKRELSNAAWALDEESVEYIEADLVDGKLVAKAGAEWQKATGATFSMPNSHVLVRANIFPTGNSVLQFPELRHGKIIATPWANVPLDTDVMLVAEPDEGYELEGGFSYTQVGQILWHNVGVQGNSHNAFKMPGYSVYVNCKFKPLQYTVTAEQLEGGELLPTPQKASVGSVILVDYSRAAGWDLVPGSIEWAREGSEEWTKAEEGRFTMPAANVKVRAQFHRIGAEEFEITLKVNGNGQLEVFDGEFEIVSKMRVSGGTKLRITQKPEERWQSAGLQINGNSYTEEIYTVMAPTEIVATFVEASITSVEEERLAQVYPNPFDGTLHVEANGAKEIELYSVGGVLVHRELYGDGVMNLDALPSGVYVLRIRFEDGVEVIRRVVKR